MPAMMVGGHATLRLPLAALLPAPSTGVARAPCLEKRKAEVPRSFITTTVREQYPGHNTRVPPVGFEQGTNGIHCHLTAVTFMATPSRTRICSEKNMQKLARDLLIDIVSTALFISGIGATGLWVQHIGPHICTQDSDVLKVLLHCSQSRKKSVICGRFRLAAHRIHQMLRYSNIFLDIHLHYPMVSASSRRKLQSLGLAGNTEPAQAYTVRLYLFAEVLSLAPSSVDTQDLHPGCHRCRNRHHLRFHIRR